MHRIRIFHVGSCVKAKDGKYFIGANMLKNASYRLINCLKKKYIFKFTLLNSEQTDIEVSLPLLDRGYSDYALWSLQTGLVELLNKETPIILETKGKIRKLPISWN